MSEDMGSLSLSIVALAAMSFVLGVFLVPVWPPEVIPVLAAGSVTLMLASQALALRNAVRRRDRWWLPVLLLFGPVGPLAYSLTRGTRSGELAGLLEKLADHTGGPRRP